jgi:hypothetical protein
MRRKQGSCKKKSKDLDVIECKCGAYLLNSFDKCTNCQRLKVEKEHFLMHQKIFETDLKKREEYQSILNMVQNLQGERVDD